jgi:hypothetical protein
VLINETPSPNVYGITNTNMFMPGNNPKHGPISLKIPRSPPGVESYQEIRNSKELFENKFCQNTKITPRVCPPPPTPMPRASVSSAKTPNFRVYSHKVHGLRDEAKLEHIPPIMKKNKSRCIPNPRNSLSEEF